jgi:uroporphyrin-3 C-methyltransferase
MIEETLTPIKVKGKKRATFAVLLSFIALGSSGYIYYHDIKAHASTTYRISALDNTSATNNAQVQQDIVSINQQISALKSKVESFNTDKFSATTYQLNALISLVTQSLVAYHDVNGAIKLLTYTQGVINANNSPIYTDLKAAVTTDLDKLKQMPVIDRVVIATKLNNIVTSTDNLDLIVNNESSVPFTVSKADKPIWLRFLNEIRTRLFGLVQISNANNNDALNLLPQNSVIIHQNVKLDILNARMALLQNDEANWQYSLNQAKQGLTAYFINSITMNNVIKEIDQLLQLNIAYNEIGIETTLKALNKLNNLEK